MSGKLLVGAVAGAGLAAGYLYLRQEDRQLKDVEERALQEIRQLTAYDGPVRVEVPGERVIPSVNPKNAKRHEDCLRAATPCRAGGCPLNPQRREVSLDEVDRADPRPIYTHKKEAKNG